MVTFYDKLLLNRRTLDKKANALRAASLHMMKDQRYRHPFYWAGFVLVGGD
jgi:CHAT domain-containing protein